jgi:hypothetical protein
VTGSGDDVAERFRSLLGRRHFVDREPGVLLVWLPTDQPGIAELVSRVEARHPGTRIGIQETGAAVAVRITGRDEELALLEELYVGVPA